jgi:hypothetical protein
MFDPLNPVYYQIDPSGIQTIDFAEHFSFNLGNVIKYVSRAGKKDPILEIQDLKKAAWYLDREIDRLTIRQEQS